MLISPKEYAEPTLGLTDLELVSNFPHCNVSSKSSLQLRLTRKTHKRPVRRDLLANVYPKAHLTSKVDLILN